jgi:hypothetical protein
MAEEIRWTIWAAIITAALMWLAFSTPGGTIADDADLCRGSPGKYGQPTACQ